MRREMEVDLYMRGQLPSRALDHAIARFAAGQHDVVARHQLLAESFKADAIDRAVQRERLHAVMRGVYTVSRNLSRRGWWMAAVLAAGPGAVLSHRAAAALQGIRPSNGLEVTTPRDHRLPKVIVHRATIPPDEQRTIDGIPTTGPSRTLLDLAAVLPQNHLERATRRVETNGLTDTISLAELLARYPRRRGTRRLRAILDSGAFTAMTRSELEDAFLDLLREHGVDRPQTNAFVEGKERDAVWTEHRLVVELDGRQWHTDTHAFEHDRERDRALTARGWRVVRVTAKQLADPGLIADLRVLLSRPSMSAGDDGAATDERSVRR